MLLYWNGVMLLKDQKQKIMHFLSSIFFLTALAQQAKCTTSSDSSLDPDAGSCLGTNWELGVGKNRLEHYEILYERYYNCTIVKGNLEISGLIDVSWDLSFLENIEVVTGYVLISSSFVPYLPLNKLRVIRGRSLYLNKYALFVHNNINLENPKQHLEQLRLESLSEIVQGGVFFDHNSICFVQNILWKDLFTKLYSDAAKPRPMVFSNEACGTCHPSCPNICETGNATHCENEEDCKRRNCTKRCWGPGPEMCQKLNQVTCDSSCQGSRCHGPLHEDCCDRECAAGCTGPTDTDCMVCLHVNDSGSCQYSCPPSHTYDPGSQSFVPNPLHKYHYSDHCVQACPSNLLVEKNGCVKTCSVGYHHNGKGQCIECKPKKCDKECYGVEHHNGPLAGNRSVDSSNIHHFDGCNIIKGNLYFDTLSFGGEEPITDDQLDALKSITKITGYLVISSWSKNKTSFSAFENLEEIVGADLFQSIVALAIQDTPDQSADFVFNEHITSLGFRSLKTIYHGNVFISRLENLCYDRLVNWSRIIRHPMNNSAFDSHGLLTRYNKKECNNTSCSPLCDDNGCWGPGADECLSCRYKSYDGTCFSDCIKEMGLYSVEGDKECQVCDEECTFCSGPGPGNCSFCKHFRNYDGECVKECPVTHYGDPEMKECLPCNETCAFHPLKRICTGPLPLVEKGGCNFCEFAIATKALQVLHCLPHTASCPDGHFSIDKFNDIRHTCVPCHEGCKNCTGPSRSECLHTLPLTSEHLALSICMPLVVITLAASIAAFYCRYRKHKKRKQRQRSMKELGIDVLSDEQSMDPAARLMGSTTPSGVAPNQAQLRIVKETELRIGKILGSGAFGTVHKGFWIPDRAKEKIKVPVAIKVLREESSQKASNEILDEAFLMASCKHPYLMRLLGISLSQQIMLVTQLMPSGNLLDYVRDNKDKIGSQHLLNWSLQISKGMCYLAEEKHLVHRDLAARNVLVKSPHHVCITDFGLAKLLDVHENAYRAEGGKMPIKWLALESIQHRIFTHKSDVWSFGVTMWELLTFGKKPYENVLARDVYALLERGERLSQPLICTIDVYMLLIKCWTVDADARPTFSELSEELLRMAKDPPRYIVIENEGMLKELQCPTMEDVLDSLNEEQGDGFVITDAEMYQRQLDEGTLSNGDIPSQSDSLSLSSRGRPHRSISSTSSSQNLRSSGRKSGRFNPHGGRYGNSMNSDKRSDFVFTNGANLNLPLQPPTNLEDIDEMQYTPRHNFVHEYRNGIGLRYSDNQDVFDPPTYEELSQLAESEDSCVRGELQPRQNRAREDSTTLRYSADPISVNRRQSATSRFSTNLIHFEHDDLGYLAPLEAVNKRPEYLDPSHPPSPSSIVQPLTRCGSAVTNPEYDATFDFKDVDPHLDSDGYEIPLTLGDIAMNIDPSLHIRHSESNSMYLLRHDSQSSTSLTSAKLGSDSGMQSEEDGERRKTSVVNPNYEWCGEVPSDRESDRADYENMASEITKLNYGEDDIFNSNVKIDPHCFQRDVIERTYSEPDSGVGIEVAANALTYKKQAV